jgi:hypothetical protein
MSGAKSKGRKGRMKGPVARRMNARREEEEKTNNQREAKQWWKERRVEGRKGGREKGRRTHGGED